ncbi:DUF4238 domain-containing protein [Nocardia cyriacigeorgica]|uniref:DUF4238 domain-containing protein n=1 Tax=Nocardia cyriacigeorgica TaxID=135487 RepID=UPI002456E784|nr:DUF4238 domain-containing protein [Nocardia cyriacigeorgica]
MDLDFLSVLGSLQPFRHRWLSRAFVDESKSQAWAVTTRKQHYVPESYLRRWAVDGLVQPFQVDKQIAYGPQPPKEVGQARNLYTLPEYEATMGLPLRWVEKHLSRIEDPCAKHLDTLIRRDAGPVKDPALRRDMSVFLGLQATRTLSQRERHLAIINGPRAAKREFLKQMAPGAGPVEIYRRMQPRYSDPKHEAIHLMVEDVRTRVAPLLHLRSWAVYRTTRPIVTCDDPVLFLAGPPFERSWSIVGVSAVVLYPLDPFHLLVMLRWDLHHSAPYILDADETTSINLEIIASATRTSFERPGDDIGAEHPVPARRPKPELTDEAVQALDPAKAVEYMFGRARQLSRWAEADAAPAWPVPRWYQP